MMLTEEDHAKTTIAAVCEEKLANAKMDWDINDNHFPKLQQVKICALFRTFMQQMIPLGYSSVSSIFGYISPSHN